MDIRISEQYSGRTLLSYLKFTLKLSSAFITHLKLDPHGLEVNGSHVTVRYILQNGDLLHIGVDDREECANTSILPVDMPLDIIYEDDGIIAVNKPPFMPTHPSHDHHGDTLANAVAYEYKNRGIPFVFRPIGRLDRNTSGIVILAKNMPAASHFAKERSQNNLRKSYIAILCGEMSDESGIINTPLKRQDGSVIVRIVCDNTDEGALPSKTVWKKLYSGNGITLVRAYPETGRTHQLRVHFASIGHPILGDDLYGEECDYIKRHALHAYTLKFTLPFSYEDRSLCADIPADMRAAFNTITGEDIDIYLDPR